MQRSRNRRLWKELKLWEGKIMSPVLTKTLISQIEAILRKGNQAEVKIEQGQIAVVEIRRKLRLKEDPTVTK